MILILDFLRFSSLDKVLLLLNYSSSLLAIRLFNPKFTERIQHTHIKLRQYPNETKMGSSSFFLNLCQKGYLPPGFPLFLCPLQFLLSIENEEGYVKLYEDTETAVAAINNVKNHPCAHPNESCVIAFLPFDRILFGCSKLENQVDGESNFGDFHSVYVVSHNFSRAEPCIYDIEGKNVCSLDTTFVEGYILIEEHKCCCQSGQCVVVLFDQSEMLLPLMKTVDDLPNALADQNPVEAHSFTTESSENVGKRRKILRNYRSMPLIRRIRIPLEENPSNVGIIIVMPVFLMIICVICVVAFFNICRDDLIDELHSSGIDVIRSEEGAVKQAPREYE